MIESEEYIIRPFTAFEQADLAGLQAIILNQAYTQNGKGNGYSNNEIAAIHAFVANGGGFVILGNGGDGSYDLAMTWLTTSTVWRVFTE